MEIDRGFYIFPCPHCQALVMVHHKEINCAIFRHAVFRRNMKPINPHSSEAQCYAYLAQGLIYGCAKPYQMYQNAEGNWQVRKCQYI